MQAFECPDIIGVNQSPRQVAPKTEVFSEHRFGFVNMALLEQQGTKGMPCWLHPAPWLVIVKIVFEAGRLAQGFECVCIGTFSISDFAFEHGFADFEKIKDG